MGYWSPDLDALAIKLWTVDGFSASQISTRLGGISRNGVIGRLYRLGYTGKQGGARKTASAPARLPHLAQVRASPPGKVTVITPPKAPALKIAGRGTVFEEAVAQPPRAELRPEAFAPLPGIQPIPFIERRGRCAWPVGGEGAEMLCCGAKRDGEGSYCGEHRRRGTQAVRPGSPRNGNELARSLRRYA